MRCINDSRVAHSDFAKQVDCILKALHCIRDDYQEAANKHDDSNPEEQLKKLLHLIHVEKSQLAQDIVLKLLNEGIELIFDYPLKKLASYGTLRPGESNYKVVSDIKGNWVDGVIHGTTNTHRGYPVFKWTEPGADVSVQILCSEMLPSEVKRVDEFEGADYIRTLIPVYVQDEVWVCNVYEQSDQVPN